jgi:DNA repair protein RecO (recombination protein O)
MLTPIHAICLRTVRYNDHNNILTLYTRERGRLSVLLAGGSGREAARRRALTMPLSLVEGVADLRVGRELASVSDLRSTVALPTVHADPVKMSMAMFLTELLGVVVPDGAPDEPLYNFIVDAVEALEAADAGTANFHLVFLYRLGRFIGIEPDLGTYRPGAVFDMLEGVFRMTPPLHRHYLLGEDAAAVVMLSRMRWENMRAFHLNRGERRRILSVMLDYYGLHYARLTGMKSMEILGELFD